jgi:hypothetical protein
MREFSTGFLIKQKIWTKEVGKNKKKIVWEDSGHAGNNLDYPGVPLSKADSFVLSFHFVPMEPVDDVEGDLEPGDPVPNPSPYRDTEFLKSLRSRWREIGIFPLNSSGTFSITSERIVNGEYRNSKSK